MTVLVVDANSASAAAIVSYLAKAGIDARAVDTGGEALTLASEESFAAVVVDRLLPDIPVEHVLDAMRVRSSPVVVIADALSEREYAELLASGARECVLRTELVSALATAVKALIGEKLAVGEAPTVHARRAGPRFAQVLPIAVRVATWEKFQTVYTSNISRGGVFVRSATAPIGTRVAMRFGLPDGRVIEIAGEVVHARSGSGGRKAGVGVRFVDFTDEQRQAMEALAKRARDLGYGSESLDIHQLRDDDDPLA